MHVLGRMKHNRLFSSSTLQRSRIVLRCCQRVWRVSWTGSRGSGATKSAASSWLRILTKDSEDVTIIAGLNW